MTNIVSGSAIGKLGFYHSWKYYKKIKKKAMEQEFSWSGLVIGLSIAFFVVIITAFALKLLYVSFENTKINNSSFNIQIYGDYPEISNLV